MTLLQGGGGGGQNLPSPCVCYPKDPMWNRVNPLSYAADQKEHGEILLIMADRYCKQNAGCPVHGSPHRKFEKCAARVLIHPGKVPNEWKWGRSEPRYNTGEIIVMDQVQKYMDGPRLLRMRLSEYIPQLSTRNVDLVPGSVLLGWRSGFAMLYAYCKQRGKTSDRSILAGKPPMINQW